MVKHSTAMQETYREGSIPGSERSPRGGHGNPAAAAAAKSLQSCPTLCDPIDGSPPGSPRPWDSPGKNTGVGCHFPLQSMKVKSESEAAQSCPTLSDPMDCSLPGSSIHGIFQARVLQWGVLPISNPTLSGGTARGPQVGSTGALAPSCGHQL